MAIAAVIPVASPGASARDLCKGDGVPRLVLEAFFAAIADGDVERAARFVGVPREFRERPLGRPPHGQIVFNLQDRRTGRLLRREAIDIEKPAARDRWLRAHAGERFTLTELVVEVSAKRRRYAGIGVGFDRALAGGLLQYGGKGGVDCKARRIFFMETAADVAAG